MSENNIIQTDILCIGAGIASLSTALSLMRRLKKQNASSMPKVVVIDKGYSVGSHVLSGAVIDPSGFTGLLTDEEIRKLPIEARVNKESFLDLTATGSMRIPWIPPMMHAEGYPVGSATKLAIYLAKLCEKEGVEIYTSFAATELVEDGNGRIIGVKTGAKGISKDGSKRDNFLANEEVHSKVVVLGEGACGYLTEKLLAKKNMYGRRRQSYAVGVKEIIEISPKPEQMGEIVHTFGYPADWHSYGGGFIYHTAPNQVMIGYVYGLDYANPNAHPHNLFRQFKAHPAVAEHIRGGKVVAYGAKMIPEGGYYAIPKVYNDGVILVGDSAGLVDSLRIKGIHIAMISGRVAGETLADCWVANDFSKNRLAQYSTKLQATDAWKQLIRVKNVRAAFSSRLGTLAGVAAAGLAWGTNGALPPWEIKMEEDYKGMKTYQTFPARQESIPMSPLSPDRLTDVFLSGTKHEEDQPSHIRIVDPKKCINECLPKYGAPCTRFCPAHVYELEGNQLHVDFTNCMHCKTCQVKDPLRNIQWNCPEAGGGPRYTRM